MIYFKNKTKQKKILLWEAKQSNAKIKIMGISVTNNNSIQYISITVVTIRSLNSSFRIETDLIIECVLWATSYKLYKKKI